VVDVVNNTALHLNTWQTPSADELVKRGLNLLSYYANLVVENAEKFKEFTEYMVDDAYFSKKPFADAVSIAGMRFISRLRDYSVLKYKYTGEPAGKKGAPRKYTGKVDVKNLDYNYFSMELCNQDVQTDPAVVYSQAFKRDINLLLPFSIKGGKK